MGTDSVFWVGLGMAWEVFSLCFVALVNWYSCGMLSWFC